VGIVFVRHRDHHLSIVRTVISHLVLAAAGLGCTAIAVAQVRRAEYGRIERLPRVEWPVVQTGYDAQPMQGTGHVHLAVPSVLTDEKYTLRLAQQLPNPPLSNPPLPNPPLSNPSPTAPDTATLDDAPLRNVDPMIDVNRAGRAFEGSSERDRFGTDFYRTNDDFRQGIVILGRDVAMKIGGYVKVDLIQDFDPIDSTDNFDTTTIAVGAPPRQNSRFHARQSRMNFDTRWLTDRGTVRVFVEGDFFSDGDQFRLRHAYAEVGNLIIGQTWTTFTDVAAQPNTLDMEGAVSSVSRRQGQIRWTQPIFCDNLTLAFALEDSQVIFQPPSMLSGDPRTESPDAIARLRYSLDWGRFQVAGVVRELGYQPTGMPVVTGTAKGVNFTGAIFPTEVDKGYFQVMLGEGVGSYRGLPDVAPVAMNQAGVVETFGWLIGWTHEWRDDLSSNVTYSESRVDNLPGQAATDLHKNNYLAVNLIWEPIEHMFVGIEYLYGTRADVDGQFGAANRLQASFGFYLP
jgi:hypothetical protein